jgi:hypothetical protein
VIYISLFFISYFQTNLSERYTMLFDEHIPFFKTSLPTYCVFSRCCMSSLFHIYLSKIGECVPNLFCFSHRNNFCNQTHMDVGSRYLVCCSCFYVPSYLVCWIYLFMHYPWRPRVWLHECVPIWDTKGACVRNELWKLISNKNFFQFYLCEMW